MQRRRALEGIKVADFSWVVAGPLTTKCLADHGATVVKVESMGAIDFCRTLAPMVGGVSGVNRCAAFAGANTSKYSMGLNLKHPQGVEIAKRLVAWSDVVIESFVPGTMARMGLGYQDLVKLKPDLIMFSLSMQGQTGPQAQAAGFGIQLAALSGFSGLVGEPHRSPVVLMNAYTDLIAPWYSVVAILGALDYRQRTGEGQYIDLSQLEAGVSFLSPAILDYTANGRAQTRAGNRHAQAAPHGGYRCRGDDRWCVIAVFDDRECASLFEAMGRPEWTADARFATLPARKEHEEELDRLVEGWTVEHTAEEVMEMLQSAGVRAGVVATGRDLHQDPQLAHREHFVGIAHPEMGVMACERASFRLSKTPGVLEMPAPSLGEHTEHVCTQFLGMSDEEFTSLLADGVFE